MGVWEGVWLALQDRDEQRRIKEDREFEREKFATELKERRRNALLPELLKRRGESDLSVGEAEHHLRTLKAMGASDETIASVGGYGASALAEAVELVKSQQEKFAGTTLEFGPANIDALLSSAVTTTTPGNQPDWESAMAIYGLTEEDLETEITAGVTYRDALAKALTSEPTVRTTFIEQPMGKPLTPTEVSTIQSSAAENLTDTLMDEKRRVAEEIRFMNEKLASGEPTSEEVLREQKRKNERLLALGRAEEALKAGAPGLAVELVGGQAIMPFLMNNPVALEYSFGPAWDSSIRKYSFTSEDEAREAERKEQVKEGDIIIINGKIGYLR